MLHDAWRVNGDQNGLMSRMQPLLNWAFSEAQMATFNPRDLRVWAVKGAEGRLLEIAAEAAAIYRAFPELRERGQSRDAPSGGRVKPDSQGASARAPKRREMSAEARERIAAAQRKRWAALRASRAEAGDSGGGSGAGRGRSDKKR